MWIHKAGSEAGSSQLINVQSLTAIQAERDQAFGSAGDSAEMYHVIGYYTPADFLHHTHSYVKLASNLTREEADLLVMDLYESIKHRHESFAIAADHAPKAATPTAAVTLSETEPETEAVVRFVPVVRMPKEAAAENA